MLELIRAEAPARRLHINIYENHLLFRNLHNNETRTNTIQFIQLQHLLKISHSRESCLKNQNVEQRSKV